MAASRENGKICYVEIPTTDVTRSVKFYQAVFNWKTRTRGDGAVAFDDSTGQVSGSWVKGRPFSTTPGILIYIMADSVENTVKAIETNGGRIVQKIGLDAPEITARFADPDGNVLGLYQQPSSSDT